MNYILVYSIPMRKVTGRCVVSKIMNQCRVTTDEGVCKPFKVTVVPLWDDIDKIGFNEDWIPLR